MPMMSMLMTTTTMMVMTTTYFLSRVARRKSVSYRQPVEPPGAGSAFTAGGGVSFVPL